jgi:hypothetical protein
VTRGFGARHQQQGLPARVSGDNPGSAALFRGDFRVQRSSNGRAGSSEDGVNHQPIRGTPCRASEVRVTAARERSPALTAGDLQSDVVVKTGAFGSRRVCEFEVRRRSVAEAVRAASSGEKVRSPSKAFVSLAGSGAVVADSGRWRLHSVRDVKLVLGVSHSSFRTSRDCRYYSEETCCRSRRVEGISVRSPRMR